LVHVAFVTGLTIDYGELAPESLLTRALAIFIVMCGVLVTVLMAAIGPASARFHTRSCRGNRQWQPRRKSLSLQARSPPSQG